MDIHQVLAQVLAWREARNERYSQRAFARDLRIHHTTLSRILDRRLRMTSRTIRRVGPRLGLSAAQVDAACIEANAAWLARFIGDPRSAADCRRLAVLTGLPLDDVNIALHHLVHHRRLAMTSTNHWELVST